MNIRQTLGAAALAATVVATAGCTPEDDLDINVVHYNNPAPRGGQPKAPAKNPTIKRTARP